ncbi:17-beta-hydroxysteroid dehydrogenase type 6 [Trichoplax sp. H2]|uniref:Uncharacterized protein n=1 Tax=Trichoplax adhaerens TaxID=10228 RepID=B3RT58_TRIAD|nr:hypothetical protein TRIADDRAFT_54847 [Trichoplax adhaerens]EDV27167.1 hypothetical protein TRIADDRAFT_54847 [Trichoplax adhaerens]RDD45731.1 17-beta-hydroxysteroid dehydrogenase type 6 [Trichoplax sp. H2]|eukprot:XP_002111163.1 hypothetical protein TRIADDRAFT_54847 [Trichoplax adhaerens]
MTFILYTFIALLTAIIAYKIFRYSTNGKIQATDKFVLVTGCDSGFGRLTALKLDQLGCYVFAGCLTQRGIDGLRKIATKRLHPFMLDITNAEDIARAVQIVTQTLPDDQGLWGIVNNAGVSGSGLIEWVPIERYKKVTEVNLFGSVAITTAFLPLVKKSRGRIVNIGSILGRISTAGCSAYSISKYGLMAFSDALRREMKYFGVTVHTVEPGYFRTNMICGGALERETLQLYNNLDDQTKKFYSEEYVNKLLEDIRIYVQQASSDLNLVAETVADALLSTRPDYHYLIGFESKLMALIALLPTSWSDYLFSQFFTIPLPAENNL